MSQFDQSIIHICSNRRDHTVRVRKMFFFLIIFKNLLSRFAHVFYLNTWYRVRHISSPEHSQMRARFKQCTHIQRELSGEQKSKIKNEAL